MRSLPSPIFNPEDLIGCTFLMDEQEDGQNFRGCIVELIEDHESKVEDNPTRIKFRVSVNEDKAEEIITNNKMLEYITNDEESDIQWKFRCIVSHEYKGSRCNLLIKWEGGEIISEPLKIVAADDPVSCAIYARENDLPDKPGWSLSALLSEKRSSLIWSIRLCSDRTTRRLATNTDLKLLGHMNRHFVLTKETVTPYGEMLQY
jgi:hypothetical protein